MAGRIPGRTWIYILLVTACSINYIDRVVLSVSAQAISKEFEISTIQLGYLFSAFLWSYLVFVLPWGIYVDRVGTRQATTVGMAIWSAATLLTGMSWNFTSAFASRLLMGFGESSTYPAGGRTIREWMPAGERGFATTVFNCGGYIGPALGSVLMSYLVSELGWRGTFFGAGALGFLWLVFWIVFFRQPEEANFIGEAERAKILAERGGKAVPGAKRADVSAAEMQEHVGGVHHPGMRGLYRVSVPDLVAELPAGDARADAAQDRFLHCHSLCGRGARNDTHRRAERPAAA
jgi:MFS family permease